MSRKTISKPSSAERRPDLEEEDFDEAPKLDHAFFEGARIRVGRRIIREATGTYTQRGRPPLGETAKVQQSLRLSREVLDHFRATGPGWQARIDEVLRRHVAEAEAKAGERRVAEEREAWRGEGE
ncbi:MAG TPA: BrnA antitoxin family protein [Allosphingosinicella sp.]|jgi:uncharacterized protein (DUF4415 family)